MAHNKRETPCGIVAEPAPKRRKIHELMENITVPDDVLRIILSRLSTKPLMRFRCASKHWNSLITDPHFINSRSRRMILMQSCQTDLYAFDPNRQNIVKLTYPFEHQIQKCSIIGALNGIVLLLLEQFIFSGPRIFILYNPLTRATKKLPGLPDSCCGVSATQSAYGFGNGNIVTIKYPCSDRCRPTSNKYNNFYVFSLKRGSWTASKTTFTWLSAFFVHRVGMFLKGFLHWITWVRDVFKIVVLDVRKMVVKQIAAPRQTAVRYREYSPVLGTLHGCLCMSNMWRNGFDVWVKEHRKWSKQYSFALPFYRYGCKNLLDVSILEDGRILVKDEVSNQIIMCHLFERYYDIFKCADEIRVANRFEYLGEGVKLVVEKPFEYVESLVSPSDICHI